MVVILCFTLGLTVRAQQEIDDDYLSILLAEEEEHSSAALKPVIGFGVGNFSFYGDVTDYFKSPINGLTSYRFQISRNINKYFDIEFHGTLGKVGGSVYNASAGDVFTWEYWMKTNTNVIQISVGSSLSIKVLDDHDLPEEIPMKGNQRQIFLT